MSTRFGPAGLSEDFTGKSTLDAPEWLKESGLNAFEYQCGHGVNIGQATAVKIGERMAQNGIKMSLHSPYFIVLTNKDSFEKNLGYLRKSFSAARWMGADRVVVHSGIAGADDRAEPLKIAIDTVKRALKLLRDEGFEDITMCPEVMGKRSQLGTLEEVLEICRADKKLLPCVDFGHLYARTLGEHNTSEHYVRACEQMEDALGFERVRNLHIHFSRIEFKKGGEYKHLTFDDTEYGPDFEPLAAVLKSRGYTPTVICESRGTQSRDAKTMMNIWSGIK